MSIHKNSKLPLKLFIKMNEEYKERFNINPLCSSRNRENVTSRQCLGLVLTKRFNMGSSDISRLFNCDHATIIYSVKKVKEQIEVMNADYIIAINNWREILRDFSEEIYEETTNVGMIRRTLSSVILDSLVDGLIDRDDVGKVLTELLVKFSPEFVSKD